MTARTRSSQAWHALFAAVAICVPVLAGGQIDRSNPPTLGAPPELHLPNVEVRELPNGLKLMVVERHKLPVADFVLVMPGGATENPAAEAGVADLMADMLTAGTTSRTALEIADQAAFLGISLDASSGWDATTVALSTPTRQLDSALALFSDVILHPSFPEAEFARVKRERLTELLQLKDHGPAIADLAYPAILYGKDSPYGRPVVGTEASVSAMTVASVKNFYQAHFAPSGATLIVVGDITAESLMAKLAPLFGTWASRSVPLTTVAPVPRPASTTIYLIDKPGAAQSSFRIGAVGAARSTPDYFPLQVLNTALGGSFTSRLNQDLREAKGYTYGAFSSFVMRRFAGPFTARAEIVSAKSDSALLAFMSELTAIRDTIPAAELEKTKRYLELGFPAEFETTAQIAAQLADVALYHLPLDYYNHVVANIDMVTQADVQRVAQRYIDPSHLTVVIVGDRKSIEPSIRALNVAPLMIRDANGDPVRQAP